MKWLSISSMKYHRRRKYNVIFMAVMKMAKAQRSQPSVFSQPAISNEICENESNG
jgi:hypothetical protein